MKSDAELLCEYAERGSEGAFTEIVTRHTNLVYSAALRQVNAPEAAADVAQNVFVGLARGAGALSARLDRDASLAGWLWRSARNVSLNFRRDEFRQHSRERQAMEQINSIPEAAPDWERLRPVLDEAMSELGEADHEAHEALLLRFFHNQDLRSVGRALGVTDDTAQKRVARALDKLRENLSRRGIGSTGGAIAVALSANAVQAAPAGLTGTICAASLAALGAAVPTVIATGRIIAMTTLQKAFVGAVIAMALGAGIYQARQASVLRSRVQVLEEQAGQREQWAQERDDAVKQIAALREENERLKGNSAELLKLRGEATRLRTELRKLAPTGLNVSAPPASPDEPLWKHQGALLKHYFELNPGEQIPEFQFLTNNRKGNF